MHFCSSQKQLTEFIFLVQNLRWENVTQLAKTKKTRFSKYRKIHNPRQNLATKQKLQKTEPNLGHWQTKFHLALEAFFLCGVVKRESKYRMEIWAPRLILFWARSSMKNCPAAGVELFSGPLVGLNSALYMAEQMQEWLAIEKTGKRATHGAKKFDRRTLTPFVPKIPRASTTSGRPKPFGQKRSLT